MGSQMFPSVLMDKEAAFCGLVMDSLLSCLKLLQGDVGVDCRLRLLFLDTPVLSLGTRLIGSDFAFPRSYPTLRNWKQKENLFKNKF